MRLFELLENVPVTTTKQPMRTPSYRNRVEPRGEGSFGRVMQDIDNPHEVMKFSKIYAASSDGYLLYIKEVALDKKIQDNPWVPRVRSLRIHRGEDDSILNYSVRLEALSSMKDLSEEELEAITKRMFTDNVLYKIKKDMSQFTNISGIRTHWILRYLRGCMLNPEEVESYIRDPDLIEFAHWHRDVWDRYGRRPAIDVGELNIMVRRLPTGAQLVVTDPWA